METVLDGIDRSPRQQLADLGPFVSNPELIFEQNLVFLSSPWGLLEGWVKMVIVAVSKVVAETDSPRISPP